MPASINPPDGAAVPDMPPSPVDWLSPEDLAIEWNIPVRTLYSWRTRGLGPRAIRIGRHLRYARRDVDAWVEEQTRRQGAKRTSLRSTSPRFTGRGGSSDEVDR